ncbi:MAG TPA: M56 family metallopeptidase [Gemmataceae bacterium]|nr:M56 family metallopeptidase [Gemmataceae bacterium]
MSWTGPSIGQWLVHSALGGGLLLVLAAAAMRLTRQPARRQRIGELGVMAALVVAILSLAPAWFVVPVPATAVAVRAESEASVRPELPPIDPDVLDAAAAVIVSLPQETSLQNRLSADKAVASTAAEQSGPAPMSVLEQLSWPTLLAAAYGLGAAFLLARWLLGYFGLRRLLRTAESAPVAIHQLFAAMTSERCRPHLFVSRRLRVPLSCGLLRPTVVLPASLCEAPESELRWIFAHELTHLERRDSWTCLLFALGQAVFFYVPWFWTLRRQVQLCQEYVADAAAAEVEQRADYAEFLLTLTTAPTAPAWATGVSGHASDLFRRIAMLLQNPGAIERRCPRTWSLATASGLLSLAVLVAGVGLRAEAGPTPGNPAVATASDDPPKDEPKKDEPKKDKPKKDDSKKGDKDEPKKERKGIFGGDFEFPDIEEILKNLPQNLDPEKLAEIRKQLQQMRGEMRKRLDELRRNGPEGMQGRFPLLGGPRAFAGQGRLGIRVERPSPTLADQLELPKSRGLVVQDVQPDSAASRAGLKPHDILLRFNGVAVPNDPAEFAEMVRDAKADAPFDVVVIRKGREETVKGLSLPEMKTEPRQRRRPGGGIREILPYTPPPVKSDAVFQFEVPSNVV